jgi:tRNA pseudouridine38-40 synthase
MAVRCLLHTTASRSRANQASRLNVDKRDRNERSEQVKRRKLDNGEEVVTPIYATEFSKEDIENEERRPKKKVAVLIGYSGTGYKGMQLCDSDRFRLLWGLGADCV